MQIQQMYEVEIPELEKGFDKERLVKTRLNQYRFRQLVMSNYDYTCCITGIQCPELLIASHIASWSKDELNRLNPANGLCLNALHDKAFDKGLITISAESFKIRISPILKKNTTESVVNSFIRYEDQPIRLPKNFYLTRRSCKYTTATFKRN